MSSVAEMSGRPVRAVRFIRGGGPGGLVQRAACERVCTARGWAAGVTVAEYGRGFRGWAAVVRLVRRGVADLVVVPSVDVIADTDAGVAAVLRQMARAGVRLYLVAEGIDTGDPVGRGLVGSLLAGAV